uniref:Uncharacterized protein MLCB637.30 n=1 Tax=Mycobacterium leprae TaxID=1769 RepID=O33121_MYCLR|nr:hypothetical protein MLCB637.30 [Mycobacterium leprae]
MRQAELVVIPRTGKTADTAHSRFACSSSGRPWALRRRCRTGIAFPNADSELVRSGKGNRDRPILSVVPSKNIPRSGSYVWPFSIKKLTRGSRFRLTAFCDFIFDFQSDCAVDGSVLHSGQMCLPVWTDGG